MIVIDTSVVSAIMRAHLDPVIAAWLTSQDIDRLYVTSPTIFEIRFGIEMKPHGRRRNDLEASFAEIIDVLLARRVLDFSDGAAVAAARARALQKARGITASIPDSQFAGIALARGAPVATRDILDFSHIGLQVIDPWKPNTP